jgi:cell division protein FtsQ
MTRARPGAPERPRSAAVPPPERPRRHPAQRYRVRRRRAVLVAAVVVLVGLAVGVRVLLYDAGLADVEGVEVTGALVVAESDVLAAAAVIPGGPLAAVDTGAIARRVAAIPGVALVEVGREWPHTVTVAITERTPVAVAGTPQGPFLVDASGVPYTPAPEGAGLPRLNFGAVGPADPSTRAALTVLAALPEPVRAQVRTVDVAASPAGGPLQVFLGLTENRQVRWGSPDRADEKTAVLEPLLTQRGRIYDVASPELPTVRR